jgi:hypothetical protein
VKTIPLYHGDRTARIAVSRDPVREDAVCENCGTALDGPTEIWLRVSVKIPLLGLVALGLTLCNVCVLELGYDLEST